MQELTRKDIQDYCIKMLDYFNSYAKDHNITYYMAGGTLLGAVRHHGFIPWDDDVDLMVPRSDYERLIRSFDGGGRYEIISCETNDQYCTPFARIWDKETVLKWSIGCETEIGVFIDLFPIDGFPKNEAISKLYVDYLKICRAKSNSAIRTAFRPEEKYKMIKKLLKYVWRKNGNFYAKKHNQVAKKYKFENCMYVGVTTTTAHIYRERNLKSDIFARTIYLPFETLSLPAPSGYERYLQHLYGDYMQLPPEEERMTEHMFTIYKKDRTVE